MADFDAVMDQMDDFYMEADDTEKLRHLQRTHTRILTAIPLEPSIVTYSSLVSGTRQYATGDTYLRVWSVRYVRSATAGDSKMLKPISVDELDNDFGDWRAGSAGEPSYWYWRGGEIGLHNKPDTTTSGGYPNLSMEVSTYEAITGATVLPAHVPNFDCWVYDALETITLAHRDERWYPVFAEKKKEAWNQLIRYYQGRTARLNPKTSITVGSSNIQRV